MLQCPPHMEPQEKEVAVLRVYEVGYHIVPTVKEEEVEKVVADIRAIIEGVGGSFIAEGAPSMLKLAYDMSIREGEKHVEFDRSYFGWLKFEATTDAAEAIEKALKAHVSVIRALVFKTVREDTRAKMNAPTLRAVQRTDTIQAAPRATAEETKEVPVSEADLDKALETLTAE